MNDKDLREKLGKIVAEHMAFALNKKCMVPICIYCLNCMKFGQLILRKIIEIVAVRCQILRLKCTKFDFGWGSTPDPAYCAHPDHCWI